MRDLLLRDVNETDRLDERVRQEIIVLKCSSKRSEKTALKFTSMATYLTENALDLKN